MHQRTNERTNEREAVVLSQSKSVCSINDDEVDQEECEVGVYHYNYTLDLPGNETVIEI